MSLGVLMLLGGSVQLYANTEESTELVVAESKVEILESNDWNQIYDFSK